MFNTKPLYTVYIVVVGLVIGILMGSYFSEGGNRTVTKATEPVTDLAPAKLALKSLRKLNSLTEAGLTFDQYSSKFLDIKIEVDDAMVSLPTYNRLRSKIESIMNTYRDARDFWAHCTRNGRSKHGHIYAHFESYEMIKHSQYNIGRSDEGDVDSNQVSAIWSYAQKQISNLVVTLQ